MGFVVTFAIFLNMQNKYIIDLKRSVCFFISSHCDTTKRKTHFGVILVMHIFQSDKFYGSNGK